MYKTIQQAAHSLISEYTMRKFEARDIYRSKYHNLAAYKFNHSIVAWTKTGIKLAHLNGDQDLTNGIY